ncbi:TetR/AcrR family transcriptional regulator [Nocardia sp. NBC_01327]|uniref:TetR/AcrR family transcriptional regulator n=1 Tax=Nocardia sp. NBC_01327 TaxID=2903593 RepID=UPI002E0F311F|nr:TetR/AcrR family transcriptional regulator [Nocardia sp. NBC_01327]
MPRISEELWAERRRHVLISAWGCFARDGFHAASMDQIIGATGLSSSAVYRYFRSKDELIDATAEEALVLIGSLFDRLLAAEPIPTPDETVAVLVEDLHSRGEQEGYDLSQLAMQAWTEALRRPHLHELVNAYYRSTRANFAELARRWQAAGYLAPDADIDAVAALLTTLMPGLIVLEHLGDGSSAQQLIAGISGFASASSLRDGARDRNPV